MMALTLVLIQSLDRNKTINAILKLLNYKNSSLYVALMANCGFQFTWTRIFATTINPPPMISDDVARSLG